MVITVSKKLLIFILFIFIPVIVAVCFTITSVIPVVNTENDMQDEPGYIKWVDFNVSYEALCDTMEADISSYDTEYHCSWTEQLAYLAARNGNDFSKYKKKEITELMKKLENGESMEELTDKLKYYPYYKEIFDAVLGEFIGEYGIQTYDSTGTPVWEKHYGLKAFAQLQKTLDLIIIRISVLQEAMGTVVFIQGMIFSEVSVRR